MDTLATEFPWTRAYPDDIDWNSTYTAKPLYSLLDDAVAQYGDRPACDFLGKVSTYAEIGRQVNRMAKGLQQQGVGKGDRVAILLPNCPAFIVAYYATLKVGAVAVCLNPLYAERELEHFIKDSEARTIVTIDIAMIYDKLMRIAANTGLERIVICRMAEALPFPKSLLYPIVKRKDVARLGSSPQHIKLSALLANDGTYAQVGVTADDLAVLQYTGGTTGTPKGAMLSHGNLLINASQSRDWFVGAIPGEERKLAVLPFFHIFAMTVVLNLSVRLGAEMILMPRFELHACLKLIQSRKVTMFPAVPTLFAAINNCPDLSKYDIGSIRMCISGGAPLPLEVKHGFEKNTGCTLVEGYGLTECSPVAVCNPLAGLNKAGSIGLPLPQTRIRIVSLEDGTTEVPQGEKGEVCIAGPQLMLGYWRHPEETAAAIRDGWLHTGDVGYFDADGYVYIVDRIKDLILCGGFNVYPRNVEEAIYLHPAVMECVVAGVPDAYRGETVKAYIALADGKSLTAAELKEFLGDKLSVIEQPKQVEFRKSLPKTMVGKLDRKTLLEEEAVRAAPEA